MKTNKTKNRIGVDLGKDRIMIIHRKPDGNLIKESLTLENEFSREEYYDAASQFLSSFIKKCGLKSGKISFTVPYNSDFGAVKFINLPTMDKKSLDKAVKFELEDQGVVNKVESYHHKWIKVGEDLERANTSLMVSVLRKDFISMISKFKKISWDVESVEFYPVTMGKSIKENAVVFSYEKDESLLHLYIDGLLHDTSIIPSGEERVDEIIKEVIPGIDGGELKEIKKQLKNWGKEDENESFSITPFDDKPFDISDLSRYEEGLDKDILMEISMIAEQESRYITDEVKRIARQFEIRNNITIEKVYHQGNLDSIPTLVETLVEEMDADVLPLNPLLFEKDVHSDTEQYSLAYSSLLSRSSGYMKESNYFKDVKNNTDMGSILVAVLLTAAVLCGGMFAVNRQYEKRLENVQTLQKEQQLTLSKLMSDVDGMRRESEAYRILVDSVNALSTERIWMSDFLQQLPDLTPSGIAIKKVVAKDGLILLRGESVDYSNIALLNMEMVKIGEVTIDYMDKPSTGAVTIINADEGESLTSYIEFTLTVKADFPTTNIR